ncbi:penicillin acylase family protein [Salinibaculum salinum]|uniref:penicillin acylase family protein n=1 Tax=Salinibaculum salinum TaxID=3131996 RepID=UPI0030EBACE4
MPPRPTRRAVLAALAGAGPVAAAASPVGQFLDVAAPLSGSVWQSVGTTPETVQSQYGEATITYDDYHVPHVEADSETGASFAVGYAQAADRLGEMDLVRRRAGGTLAAAVGEQGLENDRFAAKMDFRGAAEASVDAISGTETETVVQAYADGVNAYIDSGPAGMEFGILGYEPDDWTILDTALVGVQLSWFLTGSFDALRRSVRERAFDDETLQTLYPDQLDHGVPVVRPGETGGELRGVSTVSFADSERGAETAGGSDRPPRVDPELVDWLADFEEPRIVGSNSWVVSGDVTESGEPIVCNDPHLALQAPPIWYQQHVSTGEQTVRGGALVGTPFVVIGENDHGAWGLTNVGADVIDFYDYETRESPSSDGQQYRYRGEWRDFEREVRPIQVAGGDDEEVTVRKTVHGVYLDREVNGESRAIGVAWTGMSGTREIEAIHEWGKSTGMEAFREATEKMDVPTQNLVYADRDGNTLYQMSGKIPIRRVDGEVVRGGHVFDGSAGEAEWDGFTPFGESSWDGFISYDEKPAVINPDYIATANQRTADNPTYPIGQRYDSGFRGTRIYERLDAAANEGDITRELARSLQTDVLSVRARTLVPAILDAREQMPSKVEERLDELAEWDYRMERDSAAALVFKHFYDAFERLTWADDFEEAGLSDAFWPQEWVLVTLPSDSEFFDGDRAAVLAEAMSEAVDTIESAGWETYGDYNVTAIDHPFGEQVPGLNYARMPTNGTPETVWAFSTEGGYGASYRLLADFGGESLDVIPGGNDGSVFSPNYEDQLDLWARGEYRRLDDPPAASPDVTVKGDDG